MRRPVGVQDVSFAPVSQIGADRCKESVDCKADAARGDKWARHVVVVVVGEDILECSNVEEGDIQQG